MVLLKEKSLAKRARLIQSGQTVLFYSRDRPGQHRFRRLSLAIKKKAE